MNNCLWPWCGFYPSRKAINNQLWIFFRYEKAIKIYEEIARHSLKINLLKYGVKGHLLNAGLCQLCKGDIVAITKALDEYQVQFLAFILMCTCILLLLSYSSVLYIVLQDLDPTFSGTRECRLLAVSCFGLQLMHDRGRYFFTFYMRLNTTSYVLLSLFFPCIFWDI